MDARKAIQKATINLLLSEPFFGSLVLKLRPKEDPTVPTICVNAIGDLRYNSDFILSLAPPRDLEFVLCHELLHVALRHFTRGETRNKEIWNMATDYAINAILLERLKFLPESVQGLYDARFWQKNAESIYRTLLKESQGSQGTQGQSQGSQGTQGQSQGSQGTQGQSQGSQGTQGQSQGSRGSLGGLQGIISGSPGGFDQHDYSIPKGTDLAESLADWQTDIESLLEQLGDSLTDSFDSRDGVGQGQGRLAGLLKAVPRPKVNWTSILSRYVKQLVKPDVNWSRPNRRYQSVYLPSLKSPGLTDIVCVIDSSGSIDRETLGLFIAETQRLTDLVGLRLTVIAHDTKVYPLGTYNTGQKMRVPDRLPYGGGTDFYPVFRWINEQRGLNPRLVIVLSDAWGPMPNSVPYPVVWILTKADYRYLIPQVGKVIARV